jgi:plastocyanin
MRVRKLSIVTALSVASLGLIGLAACSSGGNSGQPASKGAAVSSNVVQIDVLGSTLSTKYGILAPDGQGHDTFVPAAFTAKAGQTYTIKVYNYDEGPHSFTINGLVNKTIAPFVSETQPSLTTFTVTFPKTGVYRFYCKFPCDAKHGGWAMTKDRAGNGLSQDGFMAGYVNVISG